MRFFQDCWSSWIYYFRYLQCYRWRKIIDLLRRADLYAALCYHDDWATRTDWLILFSFCGRGVSLKFAPPSSSGPPAAPCSLYSSFFKRPQSGVTVCLWRGLWKWSACWDFFTFLGWRGPRSGAWSAEQFPSITDKERKAAESDRRNEGIQTSA